MPQNDLTPNRLRALIAAATPGPWIRHGSHFYAESDRRLLGTIEGPLLVENADLFLELVNHAPALADALEARELLEWLDGRIVDGAIREVVTNPDSVCLVSPESRETWGDTLIDALRAAKEAADGNI